MGLFQQVLKTYEALAPRYVGVYEAGKNVPLAPISHALVKPEIEITLAEDGSFLTAAYPSEEKIIIPVTEESLGRTSTGAAKKPHPLCDMVKYLTAKENYYIPQLEKWVGSEHSHPKLQSILTYVKQNSICEDLKKCGLSFKDNSMVCWRVHGSGSAIAECWKDRSLFDAFIRYYASQSTEADVLCYLSGRNEKPAVQHPKGVVPINGNAKLISSNDADGFSFRGRFFDDAQAGAVGYQVSQKIHSVLRWLIENQGVFFGKRAFLCWNPEGIPLHKPTHSLLRSTSEKVIPSDYREELFKSLSGCKEQLSSNSRAVIAVFDAATSGRLAVTYYNELQASDFLDRLHDWDRSCCWWNGIFGIRPPLLSQIVNCAFGIEQKDGLSADVKILRQQMQRLVACRVEQSGMPTDIISALVNRASNPMAYSKPIWRQIVYVACAAIQKHHVYHHKEDFCMEWNLDKPDRSFQFGRLLAAMEQVEEIFYYEHSNPQEKIERQTSAIKALAAFKRRPWDVFERVNAHLTAAYLPRISEKSRICYKRLCAQITALLANCTASELNQPLSSFYLIGYELQRNTFFHMVNDSQNEVEKEEE